MTILRSQRSERPAAIAPFAAVLLIPLFAMAAFAVDLGWIALVQSNLQNAADASALAGAGQLTDGYVQYNSITQSTQQYSILTTAESNAKTTAKNVASRNAADVSSLTLLDSDIQFGSTNAANQYTPSSTASGYPNTIKVTLRRDTSANGALGLFFGPILGMNTVNLQATAAATIYTANVDSFVNTPSLNAGLLPVTYDVNHWNNFLSTGMDPDGNANTDANGIPQLSVYPSIKDTGNFGQLSLDGSNAGSSTISGWVDNGLSQGDLQGLQNAGGQTVLIPLSQHNANIQPGNSTDGMGSWNWVGDPGMKTSVLHTIANHVGETYLLPLFKPLDPTDGASYQAGNGGGSHYYYNIVEFVSVKIISADNNSLVVQPSAQILDFNTVSFTTQPAGTPGGPSSLLTTFAPPKLTQ
jgi:Flp pilus assembly protein TadG